MYVCHVHVPTMTILSTFQHLRSSKHQQYANNDSNFCKLDELIALCTPVAEFLAELRQQVTSDV